ncbi:Reverse transcriptase zinc-binding domain [Macleaya cordata]|uniref:Reverse transcriptase zinc-binding domain n=1 Tax=Macleaya cordata TaxID=56857 RepID=A0A200RCL0_MACCD|nr:Reverse transcriptase zinc-binding domain [Macleaya cordata]
MGFSGPAYTWCNKRALHSHIRERLDRVLATPSWCLTFKDAHVTHLPRLSSDHAPILLNTSTAKRYADTMVDVPAEFLNSSPTLSETTNANISVLQMILQMYTSWSGQHTNFAKSAVFFSKTVSSDRRIAIASNLGDGSNIRVFEDSWIPTLPNFKPTSVMCNHTSVTWVSDLFVQGTTTWNFNLLYSLFPPDEVDCILRIDVPQSRQSDSLIWLKTPTGKFSTKSFYATIQAEFPSTSGTISTFNWKKLWKLDRCPPKIKVFAWRLLQGCLAVRTIIGRFMPHVVQHCPLCGIHNETIDHLFVQCHVTKLILVVSPLGYRIEDDNLTISGLLNDWISHHTGQEVFQLGICLLWSLWSARNKAIFEMKEFFVSTVIKDAITLHTDYSFSCVDPNFVRISQQHIVESLPAQQLSWSPPSTHHVKINVDGANGVSSSACAAVARNSFGNFQGCGTLCYGRCLPEEAEAKAFMLGVQLALKFNYHSVIIEGDASNIVHYINGSTENIPWRIRATILDIRFFAQSIPSVIFTSVRRACNHVAHELAREALLFCVSDWWNATAPPSCIVNSLSADSSATR